MIRLFTNYYQDPRPERHNEIVGCSCRNISLNEIDHVCFVCDPGYSMPSGTTYSVVIHNTRPTYADFFRLANSISDPGDIAVISNSDIFFDETIKLGEKIKENECYALSRWDVKANGRALPFHRADSQDVWIFRTPIKEIEGADFPMGKAGCDNKIAYLLDQAGYTVTNPCKSIHAFHLHLSGVRNYMEKGKVIDRIPPPYKLVTPSEI